MDGYVLIVIFSLFASITFMITQSVTWLIPDLEDLDPRVIFLCAVTFFSIMSFYLLCYGRDSSIGALSSIYGIISLFWLTYYMSYELEISYEGSIMIYTYVKWCTFFTFLTTLIISMRKVEKHKMEFIDKVIS